ncbi:MAG: hypothetical protein ACU0CO_04755 [Shimia sp.]
MSGVGHNRGPSMEAGFTYRKHQWAKARAALLPTLPLSVVRMRMRRAKALGLDYSTYAGVRAASGRDVVAFLFSSNALRIRLAEIEEARAAALEARAGGKLALVHAPLRPEGVARANPVLALVEAAPRFTDSWSGTRARVRDAILAAGHAPRGVVIVGEAPFERDWADAARAAGYLPADRYFGELR